MSALHNLNLNLSSAARIDPKLTADDWKLYDFAGRDSVAGQFNAELASIVNSGATRDQAAGHMVNVMLRSPACCTVDGMPVLNSLLTAAYGC